MAIRFFAITPNYSICYYVFQFDIDSCTNGEIIEETFKGIEKTTLTGNYGPYIAKRTIITQMM